MGLIGKNGLGKFIFINIFVGNRYKDNGLLKFFNKEVIENDFKYKEYLGVVFDDLCVLDKLIL